MVARTSDKKQPNLSGNYPNTSIDSHHQIIRTNDISKRIEPKFQLGNDWDLANTIVCKRSIQRESIAMIKKFDLIIFMNLSFKCSRPRKNTSVGSEHERRITQ
ncbi:hypothetical protein AVEN_191282-1 [Araneus ventricosus]|uniref:Uncharacterized protein n=1 Tax=Araneus ventricosus TaxID=182803 RepID=A0A4Y2ITD3_ARAVE|nr:hypothetical protein AVEN_191282-1 [Araneus ventricosus]